MQFQANDFRGEIKFKKPQSSTKDTTSVKITSQDKWLLKINQRDPLAKGNSHTSSKQPGTTQEIKLTKIRRLSSRF